MNGDARGNVAVPGPEGKDRDGAAAWPAVLVTGPTASGKTELTLHLAAHGPFDIVSVDSAMIYRGMDVGTAKPDAATLARFPHALVDICDPAEAYSAGRFVEEALAHMARSRAAGRVPLLSGGTQMYLRALQRGLAPLPGADPAVRAAIDARAAQRGWPALHAELAAVDPAAAARIHPNDRQRIQRALEVYAVTGRPLTQLQAGTAPPADAWRFVPLALAPATREVLHARIEQRLDLMLATGLVEEVAALHARGDLHAALPSVRAVNYRQYWRYLEGEVDAAQARLDALHATRQLAKRQLTWLRSAREFCWLDSNSPSRYTAALELVRPKVEPYLV